MHRLRLLGLIAAFVATFVACGDDASSTDRSASGSGGDDPAATRTIEIDMVDIAFEPTELEVRRGETVRFVFTNRGAVAHDAFIGDAKDQAEHEQEMREDADDDHGHGDDAEDALTVDPGTSGELTHTFDEAGTFEIGCHQPGHYAAGMKVTVSVT